MFTYFVTSLEIGIAKRLLHLGGFQKTRFSGDLCFFALVFFIVIFDEECLSATKRGVPSFCLADETLAIKKYEKPCSFQLVQHCQSM